MLRRTLPDNAVTRNLKDEVTTQCHVEATPCHVEATQCRRLTNRRQCRLGAQRCAARRRCLIRQLPHMAVCLTVALYGSCLIWQVRREKTQQLMVRVLRAKLGRSAAVLVFEDVHWMDDSSWKLLVEVMAQVAPRPP